MFLGFLGFAPLVDEASRSVAAGAGRRPRREGYLGRRRHGRGRRPWRWCHHSAGYPHGDEESSVGATRTEGDYCDGVPTAQSAGHGDGVTTTQGARDAG
jgi:hypothetical protein